MMNIIKMYLLDMNVGLAVIVASGQVILNIIKKVVKEKNDETEYIYSNYNNYIVNINKVLSLRINELFLPNNVTIPVSRSYLTNIKKKLLEIAR